MQFDWDEKKNQQNIHKHHVSFEEAQTVFFDPLARVVPDPEHAKGEVKSWSSGEKILESAQQI
jgi:uncharacterized DUF497 family protein